MSHDKSQLLVPSRIRVGFKKRQDTYTGLIGFVIFYDTKGLIRKETSLNSWRDKDVEPVEYDNEPTEGFVLNKSAGGHRHSYSHYGRAERVRVWDPRGHEFEISIENLLFILREGTCHPGKGLDGKFVYAFDRNPSSPPVLLPVTSLDYQNSAAFTLLQNQGVKVRELVVGHTYQTKKQEQWVYLGRFDFYYSLGATSWRSKPSDTAQMKRQVFAELDAGQWKIVYPKDTKGIACVSSTVVPDNFAELVQMHTRSGRGSKIVKLFLKEVPRAPAEDPRSNWAHKWWFEIKPGVFTQAEMNYTYNTDPRKPFKIEISYLLEVKNGTLHTEGSHSGTYAYHPDYREKVYGQWNYQTRQQDRETKRTPISPNPWREETNDQLFAVLECGAEVPIEAYSLSKD